MKNINRLVCLCRGHKWLHKDSEWDESQWPPIRIKIYWECKRCGKVKEEWI